MATAGGGRPAQRAGMLKNLADLTNAAAALRTTGSSNNRMGKATNHEMPQAASHLEPSSGDMPMLFKVLIRETTQVIRIDSNKGMTKAPQRKGSLGIPNAMVALFVAFTVISWIRSSNGAYHPWTGEQPRQCRS